MSVREQLESLLSAKPFRPFRFRIADREYSVPRPEYFVLDPRPQAKGAVVFTATHFNVLMVPLHMIGEIIRD